MIFRAMEAMAATYVRRVIKVGDAVLDLLAGGSAGVRGAVGVLSGSQAVEQLGCVALTHLIASVAELPTLLGGFQQIQRLANRPDVSWVRSKGSRLTFRSRKEKT